MQALCVQWTKSCEKVIIQVNWFLGLKGTRSKCNRAPAYCSSSKHFITQREETVTLTLTMIFIKIFPYIKVGNCDLDPDLWLLTLRCCIMLFIKDSFKHIDRYKTIYNKFIKKCLMWSSTCLTYVKCTYKYIFKYIFDLMT